MDDLQRRKLRRTAKWLHWIAQIALAVILLVRIISPAGLEMGATAMMEGQAMILLVKPEMVFSDVLWKYPMYKADKLANYVPPNSKDDLAQWAAVIQDHMGQPISLFYYDGNETSWPIEHEDFAAYKDTTESLLNSGKTCTPDAEGCEQIGTLYIESVKLDTGNTDNLKIIALPESDIRWGILWDIADFIYPFVGELEKAKRGEKYDREFLPIVHQFHVRRNEKQQAKEEVMTGAYGLRIYHTGTDSILFTTPDLNTENQKFAQIKHPDLPFYYEVYNDDHDESYRKSMIELLSEPGNGLGYGSLVLAFAMFVLAMLYRFVLKATKPE